MARFQRAETPHTTWCSRDHRCGINEHRSPDIEASDIGGRAWITRVRAGDREYAEIRARIPLHSNESFTRWQLATALDIMRELLTTVAARLIQLPSPAERPAVDQRAA
jgi:hypothetical protein